MEPIAIYKGHTSVVGVGDMVLIDDTNLISLQDVDWHAHKEDVFASVGDDKMLMLCAASYMQ